MQLSKLEIMLDFILKFIHLIRFTVDKVIIIIGIYFIFKLLLQYENEKINTILFNTASILNSNMHTVFFIITTLIAVIAALTCRISKINLIKEKSELEKKYLSNDKYHPTSGVDESNSKE